MPMIPAQGANDDSQLHPANFVGRAWLFDKIDEWLASESPILWISGKPGTGKTAAISKWISTRREAAQSGTQGSADVPLAYYYCRRSLEYSRDPFRFVESLAWQAAANSEDFRRAEQVAAREEASRAGFDIRGEANVQTNYGTAVGVYISNLGARSPRQALHDKFIRPLASLSLERKPFVVIDGLDEASVSGGDGIEKLVWSGEFPADVVRMIITSRHTHRFPVANTVVINLDEFEEENADDIELYVREFQVDVELARPYAGAEAIASASGGNFLYAKHLLDYPERPPVPSASGFSRPPDLFEMYKEILRPWVAALDESKKQQWRHEVRPLIGLLAVAQSPGLSSAQLASILGLSQTMITDIMLDINNLVDGPEWGRGPWQLEHQALADFLIDEEIVIPEESHLLIGEGLVADWQGKWLECGDEYALQYALFHLSAAAIAQNGPRRNTRKALDLIADTVCDSSFLLGAPKEVIYNILMRYTRGLQLSSEAKGALSLLRRSYYSLGEPGPESRASAVALMAQQLGLSRIAREVAEVVPSSSSYSPNWVMWDPEPDFDLLVSLKHEPIRLKSMLLSGRDSLIVFTQHQVFAMDIGSLGNIVHSIEIDNSSIRCGDAIVEDGRVIVAVGTDNGQAFIYELQSSRRIFTLRDDGDGAVTSLRFYKDAETGRLHLALGAEGDTTSVSLTDMVAHVSSPQGSGGPLQLWDCGTGDLIHELASGHVVGYKVISILGVGGTVYLFCMSRREYLDETETALMQMQVEVSFEFWNLTDRTRVKFDPPDEINLGVVAAVASGNESDPMSVLVRYDTVTASDEEFLPFIGLVSVTDSELRSVAALRDRDSLGRHVSGLDPELHAYYSVGSGAIEVIDISDGACIGALNGISDNVRTGAVVRVQGELCFVGATKEQVKLWKIPGVQKMKSSRERGRRGRSGLLALSDHEVLDTSGYFVQKYEISNGALEIVDEHDSSIWSASRDEGSARRIVSVDGSDNIHVLDFELNEILVREGPGGLGMLHSQVSVLLVGDSVIYAHGSVDGQLYMDVWNTRYDTYEKMTILKKGPAIVSLDTKFHDGGIWVAIGFTTGAIVALRIDGKQWNLDVVYQTDSVAMMAQMTNVRLALINEDMYMSVQSVINKAEPITLVRLTGAAEVAASPTPFFGEVLSLCNVNGRPWLLLKKGASIYACDTVSGNQFDMNCGAEIGAAVWVGNNVVVSTERGIICFSVPWRAAVLHRDDDDTRAFRKALSSSRGVDGGTDEPDDE